MGGFYDRELEDVISGLAAGRIAGTLVPSRIKKIHLDVTV